MNLPSTKELYEDKTCANETIALKNYSHNWKRTHIRSNVILNIQILYRLNIRLAKTSYCYSQIEVLFGISPVPLSRDDIYEVESLGNHKWYIEPKEVHYICCCFHQNENKNWIIVEMKHFTGIRQNEKFFFFWYKFEWKSWNFHKNVVGSIICLGNSCMYNTRK